MSKTFAISLAGATGAVGTAAAGAYHYGAFSSKSPNIGDRLQTEKYTLLKESDSTNWTKSLAQYKKKNSDKSTYTEKELKDLCKKLLSQEERENDSYSEARKYCVVPTTISGRLTSLNLNVLDATGSGDVEKWKGLSKEYKTKGIDSKKLDDLVNTNISDENDSGNTLKSKCKTVLEKEHWDDNYDSLIKGAESWCTLQGFNSIPK
ncbi:hypothetical protein HF1_08150 [Mycoplasma haemofelis str. Langford 1]|uniref:Uncharacterized protein n=1 Tax=Mycoplasma haemofelis (strain Langford 1) TaxID=941640 RepID=E8ZI52_MYCHL|nr:hypothetical protein [Mycoplasma haemofelis]CBY92823.1 hypothetical protein HF1_08150 [Mycoplasma haemofelis str. Langford 1]